MTYTAFEDGSDLRRRAAESLESAADSIRHAADGSADTITDFADAAGEKLDASACYVRHFAGGDIFSGVKRTVRQRPVESIALATAAGLLTGFLWHAIKSHKCDEV